MKLSAKICLFITFAFIAISVCACGKASRPSPMDESGYPHTYPRY